MDLFNLLVDIIEDTEKIDEEEKSGLIQELYNIFSQLDDEEGDNPFKSARKPIYYG